MRAPLFVVALALFAAGSASAAADVSRELAEIESLAVRGQADAAIDGYRSLLERGVDFPALRYNLGTLYLEEGDVGRAVLHLKSAVRGDPRLDDARYNLERALEARADALDGEARAPGPLTIVASAVRSSEAALAFAASLLLLMCLLGVLPWTRPRTALRRTCTGALLVSIVALSVSALLLGARVQADALEEAVILDEEVSARVAPSVDAATAFVAHAGLLGEVIAEESGFLRLRLENGLDAWFPLSSLGRVADERAP